jgi:hypothetical protein
LGPEQEQNQHKHERINVVYKIEINSQQANLQKGNKNHTIIIIWNYHQKNSFGTTRDGGPSVFETEHNTLMQNAKKNVCNVQRVLHLRGLTSSTRIKSKTYYTSFIIHVMGSYTVQYKSVLMSQRNMMLLSS